MSKQIIFYDRTPSQRRLLAASCYTQDNVDDNLDLEQEWKRNKLNDSVDESRIYCSYCRYKFNTDVQGLGIPRLTKGCLRKDKVGSREHRANLRDWRKIDSHSDLKGVSVGIEENYGCISCCLCAVCKKQFELIDSQISNKESRHASSVQLPPEQLMENLDDYHNYDNTDYDEMNNHIAIGDIGATQIEYLNAIYGPCKGCNILLELIKLLILQTVT